MLRIADELERRDERLGSAVRDVESLAGEVEEARAHAQAAAAFLAGLPDALAEAGEDERAAEEARAAAAETLRAAEAEEARVAERGGENERLAAARASQQARDALRETEIRVERAREEHVRLAAEGEARRREAEELERRARMLASRLAALPGRPNVYVTLGTILNNAAVFRVLLDGRSAGFSALGLARTSRRPVVLLATSGTATVEFAPAVVEATRRSHLSASSSPPATA